MENDYSQDSYITAVTGSGQTLGYDYKNSGWCKEIEKIIGREEKMPRYQSIKIYNKISVKVRKNGQELRFSIIDSKYVSEPLSSCASWVLTLLWKTKRNCAVVILLNLTYIS